MQILVCVALNLYSWLIICGGCFNYLHTWAVANCACILCLWFVLPVFCGCEGFRWLRLRVVWGLIDWYVFWLSCSRFRYLDTGCIYFDTAFDFPAFGAV